MTWRALTKDDRKTKFPRRKTRISGISESKFAPKVANDLRRKMRGWLRIGESFRAVFPDSNIEREINFHSPLAGTGIDVLINLLVLGGGIASAELIKEITKDIWKAVKACFTKSSKSSVGGDDHLSLCLPYKDCEVSVELRNILHCSEQLVEYFIKGALLRLHCPINDLSTNDGWAESIKMKVVVVTQRIRLTYMDGKLSLLRPICPSCKFLESAYIVSPCK